MRRPRDFTHRIKEPVSALTGKNILQPKTIENSMINLSPLLIVVSVYAVVGAYLGFIHSWLSESKPEVTSTVVPRESQNQAPSSTETMRAFDAREWRTSPS